jgi:hypothetical protein
VQRYPSGCPYFTAPKSSNPIFNLYLKTQPSALSPQPSASNAATGVVYFNGNLHLGSAGVTTLEIIGFSTTYS